VTTEVEAISVTSDSDGPEGQEPEAQMTENLADDTSAQAAVLAVDTQEPQEPQEPQENSEGEDGSSEDQPESESTAKPEQSEMPFAIVQGQAVTELPKDLYIPPDALEVILEAFEGPLDLLLYLIRRQNLDILEINVADITKQYIHYVEMMDAMQFELAAEYLLMAAMLAEIKSRMLLPRSSEEEEDEEDPRAQLIRRLQEYERFKTAAEDINELPRQGRDTHQAIAEPPGRNLTRPEPEVDLKEVLLALAEVLRRADMFESHHVEKEKLSTRERMTQVLDQLSGQQFMPFVNLFKVEEGRLGVVVTFLAVMELIKESLVEIVQSEAFGPIHVKARSEGAVQI
jgi:segregation and condensation protein A